MSDVESKLDKKKQDMISNSVSSTQAGWHQLKLLRYNFASLILPLQSVSVYIIYMNSGTGNLA